LSSALSFRAARDESEIRETIREIKAQREGFEELLRDEYEVSIEEAERRLTQLRFGLMGVITFLSSRIPNEAQEPPRN
jgi:hypothetical protein